MGLAVVRANIAPVFEKADTGAAPMDELLFGMCAEITAEETEPGWCAITADGGLEGYVQADSLDTDPAAAKQWQAYGKMAARVPFLDILQQPRHGAALLTVLPRGGLIHPLAQPNEEGWLQVSLPGGDTGYAKSGNLMPQLFARPEGDEALLRKALAATALSYLGTQYSQGGRTPLGIDGPGLVQMAYLLNGITLYRGAAMPEGYPLKRIERSALAMGDVLLFGGHMALYLDDEQYVHATGKNGSDAVVINSLAPASPFYRADLAEGLAACGSIFA